MSFKEEVDFNIAKPFTYLIAELLFRASQCALNKDLEGWFFTLVCVYNKGKIFEAKAEVLKPIDIQVRVLKEKLNKRNLSYMPDHIVNRNLNDAYFLLLDLEADILKLLDKNKLLIKKIEKRSYEALRRDMLQ